MKTPRLSSASTPLKYSVGVGEPCRSSDQFFIRGELLPIHFPLPTYPFAFMKGELLRVSGPWSVSPFGKPHLREGNLLTHFPLLTYPFLFVNGVGEKCQLSDQFFIRGEFYLPISHFPLIMKTFLERSFHFAGVGEAHESLPIYN